MKYFVKTVDLYKDAIKSCDNFICFEKNGVGIINYVVNNEETFPEILEDDSDDTKLLKTLRRNCRGLKFDWNTGEILALPHWKFFNVGERPETEVDKIDISNHYIMEKLDGSMVHPILFNEEVLWMTKLGISEVSVDCVEFLSKTNKLEKYNSFVRKWLSQNYTPIFEFVSPIRKIVVDYTNEDLILVEIRNNFTGELLSVEDLQKEASFYDIPLVKISKPSGMDLVSIIREIRDLEDQEGIIIRTPKEKYKLKSEWYITRHRAMSNIMTEKNILKLILNEQIDDVLSLLDDGDSKNRIIQYVTDIQNAMMEIIRDQYDYINHYKNLGLSKFEFVQICEKDNHFDMNTKMSKYDFSGEELWMKLKDQYIWNMSKIANNRILLDKNRIWIKNIHYRDYITGLFFAFQNE